MSNRKYLHRLPIFVALAGFMAACGSSTTSYNNTGTTNVNGGSVINNPLPLPSSSPTTALSPALSYEISNTTTTNTLTGQGGNHPVYSTLQDSGIAINTTNLLKVQVTVQAGGLLSASNVTGVPSSYSGFSATYNCANFEVDLYDTNGNHLGSQQTNMLQVPGTDGCLEYPQANGPASQILDFSGQIDNGGSHGGLDVRVSALDYDFYCQLLYDTFGAYATESSYYALWCPQKIVYKNHTIGAGIEVEVNGTTF